MLVCSDVVGESGEDEVFFLGGVGVEEVVGDVGQVEVVEEPSEAASVLGVGCGSETFVEGGIDRRRDAAQEEIVGGREMSSNESGTCGEESGEENSALVISMSDRWKSRERASAMMLWSPGMCSGIKLASNFSSIFAKCRANSS